jgi:hypothetical protein
MASRLVLYGGRYCHLCQEARALIYSVLPPGLTLQEILIDDSPELKARYGLTIPVVAVLDAQGEVVAEKGWPFSAGQVKRLLAFVEPE